MSGDWLKVELRLFRAYVSMLPRLRAEEELAAIQVGHAFTERPLEGPARKSYVGDLKRLATAGRKVARKKLGKGDMAALEGMGIAVKRQGAAAETTSDDQSRKEV